MPSRIFASNTLLQRSAQDGEIEQELKLEDTSETLLTQQFKGLEIQKKDIRSNWHFF